MIRPAVSVILTTYNVEKYVKESLLSVCNQTLREMQIIVVDDGSRDKTPEILREMAAKDSRIHLILLEKNTIGGVATPANLGIEAAIGEYIGFADGDDIYDSTAFEKLYNSAKKYDSDIAICQYADFEDKTHEIWKSSDCHLWGELPPEDFIIPSAQEKRKLLAMSPVPWRKLYKKSFMDQHHHRFPEVDYFFEDNPLHWAVILSCQGISFVREILCYHRMNRTGQTMAAGNLKVLNMFNHYGLMKESCINAISSGTFVDKDKSGDTHGGKNPGALAPQLLRWVVAHCYWCAEMVGPQHYDAVIAKARPLLEEFSAGQVIAARSSGVLNDSDLRIVHAIKTADKDDLTRIFGGKPQSFVPRIRMRIHYHGRKHVLRNALKRLRSRNDALRAQIAHLHWDVNQAREAIDVHNRRMALLGLLADMRGEQKERNSR